MTPRPLESPRKMCQTFFVLDEAVFPEIIPTRRLLLRKYTQTDCPSIFSLVDKNKEILLQSFADTVQGLSKPEDAGNYVEGKTKLWQDRKLYCYGLWLKNSEELIGQLQIKNITWQVPAAELSYFIDSSSRRKGFATEAVSEVLHQAFHQLKFKRIFVRIIPSNKESTLLVEKLGFRHEGLHRSEYRCGLGTLCDMQYLSLLDTEFLARQIP